MKSTFKHIILAILILMYQNSSQAQTITKNVLTTPCNCNGQVEYTFSNFGSFPISVWYYLPTGSINKRIYTNKDTLTNICQGAFSIAAYSSSSNSTINENYNIFTVSNLNITHAVCPALGSIGVTVSGGASPLTFSCKDINTNTVVGTTNPISVPGGNYIYTVKDANGCTYNLVKDTWNIVDTIIIEETSNIHFSIDTIVASCTNGSSTISGITGAVAPYSYLWNNGATTSSITGLITGNYSVTLTDALGCKSTSYTWIPQYPQISTNYTATPATCIQNDGALIAFGSGGQNPYTYSWSTGATTQSVSGLIGGSYSFTVSDKNGCIGSGYAYVPTSTPIAINYSSTPSSCTSPTGSATLNITGGTTPYVTTWNLYPSSSTGNSISGKAEGSYSFRVVDNVGCVQTGTVLIPPISSVSIINTTSNATCPANNGSISLSASGVSPISFLWNNGATTNTLSSLAAGYYSVVVTDGNGCKKFKDYSIGSSPGFNVGISSTNVSCKFSTDGSATALAGGTGPYTYQWSNGANTASVNSLSRGQYWVTATNSNGCKAYHFVNIENNATSDACYCTIQGKVYHDANDNCTLDAGENGIENIMMHLQGFGYSFTDVDGNYSFQVPSGTYKLSQEVKSIFPMSSCQTKEYNVTVTASSGCTQTFNFADSLIPSHDLFIATVNKCGSNIIPGEVYTQRVLVKNLGNVTESNVKLGYKHDNQLSLNSTTSSLSITSPTRIDQSSNFPILPPGAVVDNLINYVVPTNIPINTQVIFQDTITKALPLSTEWLDDMSPWNNVNYFQGIVVSSYDPNHKEVLPKGVGEKGIIPKDTKQLTYTINFQNLGTSYAKKVEIIDTLDANVELGSLTPIAGSHKYQVLMNENGVVHFLFDKIYLPTKISGGDASNGYITYAINLKKDLPVGTEIKNFADIYFDYNAPVRTNTAINTIEKSIASIDNNVSVDNKSDLTIYPNPASDKFTTKITLGSQVSDAMVSIFDLQGKEIYQWNGNLPKGENSKEFDTEKLSNGIYIINLNLGNKILSKKLVISK